jgi:hypothetical protein
MFPNLKNRKFTDINSNSTVTVIDQFENIAILDNKQRIDVKRLLDSSFYDEYIDPKNFLGESNYQIFAEKIKSIPSEALQNMKDDDSPIITSYDPEEEKRALMEKARQMSSPVSAIQSQVEKFRDLMDEEPPVILSEPQSVNTQTQQVAHQKQVITQSTFVDPIVTMFKNVKRNTDFSLSIDIIDKIPRPDFIEMMEDSYETSIIDYLASEFTQNILNDPDKIKLRIKEEIEKIVYKKSQKSPEKVEDSNTNSEKSKVVRRTTRKKETVKND